LPAFAGDWVKKMKVLITGNMGYIGSVTVPYLASLGGYELYGFDIGYFEKILTGPCPEHFLTRQERGDICYFPEKLLEGVEAVIHLAALSNDVMGFRFDNLTEAVNYQASLRLAQLAKAHGVPKFIFASSCSLYGAGGDSAKTEQDSINPLTAYARSKAAVEAELKILANSDFQVTCLRFATACGASSRLRLDLVLNDFVATAFSEHRIRVQSDGSPIRPLIHVKDMARSLAWALNRFGDNYLVVNVGSDRWNYQIRDLAHACALCIPQVQVEINQNAAPDKRSYRVNFSKYQSLAPHHQPQMELPATIESLLRMCKNLNLEPGFRRNYIRLAVLEEKLSSLPSSLS